MEAKTFSGQVFSENCRGQVPSLKILSLKKLECLPSFSKYVCRILYFALSEDPKRTQTSSNLSDEFYKSCLSNEAKSANGQVIFENSERRVPFLKILALRKLENLPSSNEYAFRILYSVFTGDSKGSQTYSGSYDEDYRICLTNDAKSVNDKVLFENNERQVPSLRGFLKKLENLPSSSSSSAFTKYFKSDQKYSKSFHESYKSCKSDKAKSVNVLFKNSVKRVPSLKFLALRKLECLPSSNEYAFRTLCSALTEYSKSGQNYSDSSDESYETCLSHVDQLEELDPEELEPKVTFKSPEIKIVMKERDFLDHCDSVKSGAMRFQKTSHVLRRKCSTDTSKDEGMVQHNLRHRPEGGDIQITFDEDSQENNSNLQGSRRNVRDLVRYFDSVFK